MTCTVHLSPRRPHIPFDGCGRKACSPAICLPALLRPELSKSINPVPKAENSAVFRLRFNSIYGDPVFTTRVFR